jgi:hypothetical protein
LLVSCLDYLSTMTMEAVQLHSTFYMYTVFFRVVHPSTNYHLNPFRSFGDFILRVWCRVARFCKIKKGVTSRCLFITTFFTNNRL